MFLFVNPPSQVRSSLASKHLGIGTIKKTKAQSARKTNISKQNSDEDRVINKTFEKAM